MSKRFEDYMREEDQPWIPRISVPKPKDDADAGWRDGIAWAMVLSPEDLDRVGSFSHQDGDGESPYILMTIDVDSGDYGPAVELLDLDKGPWIQFASSVLWLMGNREPSIEACREFWRDAGSPDEQPPRDYVGGFCEACQFVFDLARMPYMGRRESDDFSWAASLYRYCDHREVLVDIVSRMPQRMREEFLASLLSMILVNWSGIEYHFGHWCPMMIGRPEVGNVLATMAGKDMIRFKVGGIDRGALFKVVS